MSLGLLIVLSGCASSKLAGNWSGSVKPSAEAQKSKGIGYSETKRSLKSSLTLNGDGSYTAKLQEVEYTGDWSQSGTKVTLKPKTYMGMSAENFPKTKKEVEGDALQTIFKAYDLEVSADEKSMTHTGAEGTTTFSKQD